MAMVKKYKVEVDAIENPFDGVYTITFKSLSGRFRYKPGQFLHLALDDYDPSGAWPESRCFSMQTCPQEEVIKITYAVKGGFTQRMEKELHPGSQIWLKLPYGDLFTQEHDKENTVFIAGGTGVTPYLSLFTDPCFGEYKNPRLFAGFRESALNLYSQEFTFAQNINPDLKIHTIYQDKEGMLDIQKILHENDTKTSFFISGPPVMIKNFKNYLITHGVAECQVKTDDWE